MSTLANDPKQGEAVQQISQAWDEAKSQLADLRQAVEKHTELAQAKLDSGFLRRDREKALAELGEAVWNLILKGKLQAPEGLKQALKLVEVAEAKVAAHQSQIGELLKESDVLAGGRRAAPQAKQTLAAKPKKR